MSSTTVANNTHQPEEDAHIKGARTWWPPRLKLSEMLVVTIIASFLIVGLGYTLYERNPNRKYDIARPGQHDDNKVLNVEDENADTTNSVTAESAKQKLDYLRKELKGLNNIGGFSTDDLSDQNIQLTPPDQPSY